MKIQKCFMMLLSLAVLCLMGACAEQDTDIPRTQVEVGLENPKDVEGLNIVDQELKLTNLTTGKTESFTDFEGINLMEGLYDCSYSAHVTYVAKNTDGEESEVKGILSGKAENVEITSNSKKITVETALTFESDDFIFEEIFFAGTLRSSGSQYYGDSYIKIYNNTDHVLYADGLAFCESKFKSTQYFDYSPDIRKDTMTIWSLYVIPGSGKEHPVMPGQSLLLCDTGIDHRTANPNSIDLSHADFEWYDVSTQPDHMDIDSPTVPNLDKWYCYTLSVFVLHNRGFRSYALARMQVPKEEYLKKFFYKYEYIISSPQGNYPWSQKAYKLPNDWIVDGVNCSVEAERQWNVLPATVDAGWTHCGKIDHDKDRYFKSVRRKMLYLDENGHRVLQDTDNSTDDFNTECIPSLIEEQNTAISADGRKAETLTYDGVQPVEE